MIFDDHVHLCAPGTIKALQSQHPELFGYSNALDNPWESYRKQAAARGIFKALAFPFPLKEAEIAPANNYVLNAAWRNQDLIIPLLLLSEDLAKVEPHIKQIAGFKEHFYLSGERRPEQYAKVYDFLQQHGLVLLIHPHMKERVSRIKYIKTHFPNLRVILAHSGRKWPLKGDDVIDVIVPALGHFEELYFDTSSIRDSTVIAKLVQKVGSERVLFGSDFPYYRDLGEDLYNCELQMIAEAYLSSKDQDNVLYRNFRRLFLGDYWIRRVTKQDKDALLGLIERMPAKEKKFLAINRKLATFREGIRNERHIHILEAPSGVVGFVRESGRPDNGAVVEEIYVQDAYRGKGNARRLLEPLQAMFDWLEAKTYADNTSICHLLEKSGFTVTHKTEKGVILIWTWKKAGG